MGQANEPPPRLVTHVCTDIRFSPNFLPDKFRSLRIYDGNQVSKIFYTSQPESVANRIKLPHSAIKARKSGVLFIAHD